MNKLDVSTSDILNLANAYAVIRANKDCGGGYVLNERYGNDILRALSLATKNYTQSIGGTQNG